MMPQSAIGYWEATPAQAPTQASIWLVGNHIVWWFTAISCVGAVVIELLPRRWQTIPLRLRWGRRLLLGLWALNFFPFFVMERELFLHHYLPALYFGILLSVVTLDSFVTHVLHARRLFRWITFALILVTAIWFVVVSPLTYGTVTPARWTRLLRRVAPLRF